jgi:hypothetical protein
MYFTPIAHFSTERKFMAKNRTNRSKAKSSIVKKSTREQRKSKSSVGTAAIEFIKRQVAMVAPVELSPRFILHTVREMMLDDAVSSCITTGNNMVERSFTNYTIKYNKNSEASKAAKDFLQWNLDNLADGQTMTNLARNANEFKLDGYAPFVKSFERGYDEWEFTPEGKPLWKLEKLKYIHPLTLHRTTPFYVPEGGDKITELRQQVSAFAGTDSSSFSTKLSQGKDYIAINWDKVVMMTYSATQSQPMGQSTFIGAYTAWREKKLLEEYTLIGVTKDLAGMPLLRMPSAILDAAAADPNSADGLMVTQLVEQLGNLHAGDQASLVLPSDTLGDNNSGTGAPRFSLDFLGVSGSGKSFDLVALVEQRKKAIYNVFSAASLISQESSGGYNQMDGQLTIHSYAIERDIAVIAEAWNNNIIPQIFRLNEWKLSKEDMPVLEAGPISDISADEFGKLMQRLTAVGLIPKTTEVINEVLERAGFMYRVDEGTSQEELDKLLNSAAVQSKSGQGMQEGMPNGVGTKVGTSGGDTSVSNADNT